MLDNILRDRKRLGTWRIAEGDLDGKMAVLKKTYMKESSPTPGQWKVEITWGGEYAINCFLSENGADNHFNFNMKKYGLTEEKHISTEEPKKGDDDGF